MKIIKEVIDAVRCYISGGISNDSEHWQKFMEAEAYLRDQGYDVINPVKVAGALPEMTYGEYMKIDLQMLEFCDAIYMLNGWEQSAGAKLEYHYATTLWKKRIKVIHE